MTRDIVTTHSCRASSTSGKNVLSHVPYEWVISHMNESCPIWMSHVPYKCVMSHMNMTQDIVTTRSWRASSTSGKYELSHVPCEWVMSHMNEPCPIWMRHVPYEWSMHSYGTWLIHMGHALHIHMCEYDSRHCYYWFKTFLLLVHDVHHDTRRAYTWVISSTHEPCHIWISHVHVTYESVTSHINEYCEWVVSAYEWVVWMSHVNRVNESRHMWMSHAKEPRHTWTCHVYV